MPDTKKPSSKDSQPPLVKDKASFRRWCHFMVLNVHQASAVLRISEPMVYKYIDPKSTTNVRSVVALACNLISEKDPDARATWIQKALNNSGCNTPWPAANPITKE